MTNSLQNFLEAINNQNHTMASELYSTIFDRSYDPGKSYLYNALINQRYDVADFLFDNAVVEESFDSAYSLASEGNLGAVKYLSQHFNEPLVKAGVLAQVIDGKQFEIIKYLIEEQLIDLRGINVARFVELGDLDVIKYLVKHGGEISSYDNGHGYSGEPLTIAAAGGDLELVKYLVDYGCNINGTEASGSILGAIKKNHFVIADYLISKGAVLGENDLNIIAKQGTLEAVKYCIQHGQKPTAEVLMGAITFGEYDVVDYLMAQSLDIDEEVILSYKDIILINALKDNDAERVTQLVSEGFELTVPVVGISNIDGRWSGPVASVAQHMQNTKDIFYLPISDKIAQNEGFMSKLSGLINPGAGDTFPKNKDSFTLQDLNPEKMLEKEKTYQKVINYSNSYHIPYLGICSGSQHLILNHDGALKPVKGYVGGNHIAEIKSGSPIHYMMLSKEEQVEAVEKCSFPEISFQVYTAHHYAGANWKLGNTINLGGVSEEGVVQSFSYGLWQFGTQFHPEKYFFVSQPHDERQKIFLNNFFDLVKSYHDRIVGATAANKTLVEVKEEMQDEEQIILEKLEECSKSKETVVERCQSYMQSIAKASEGSASFFGPIFRNSSAEASYYLDNCIGLDVMGNIA